MVEKEPSLKNITSKDYGKPSKFQLQSLQEISRPHVDSFNYFLREGLAKSVKNISPVECELPNGQRVSLCIQDAEIGSPVVSSANQFANTLKVYPAECRERGSSYKGQLQVQVYWTVNGKRHGPLSKIIGEVPIMVKSSACNLYKISPAELIQRGEEGEEWGGYFIINGNEKLIRMLIMPRRNYPMAILRKTWSNRGPQYTEFGIQMRCVKDDQTNSNITLHYLTSGSANICFSHRKEQFFAPVILILKALVNMPDQYIYQELTKGKEDKSFYKGCIANMLRLAQAEGMSSQRDILTFIGSKFRVRLPLPDWKTDEEVAEFLIKQSICIHLETNTQKFDMLVYMTKKLFSFAKGECSAENVDSPMFQEVLLPGHLYQIVLKEKIESWLGSVKSSIERLAKKKGPDFVLDSASVGSVTSYTKEVTYAIEYLMATGNLASRTGLGLMQATGFVVLADKLNFYRYLSHFRCIHRGAFFQDMRTTSVRKLLPEAWGFLCPVHTPDGSPCGLLNHMTATCHVVNDIYHCGHLIRLLYDQGCIPYNDPLPGSALDYYPVMMDGQMVGWVHHGIAGSVVEQIRCMKVNGLNNVPPKLEVCLVPKTEVASQSPGLYLFTTPSRMMRPVTNLAYKCTEMIGSFEQVYMDICVIAEEAVSGVTTHQEKTEYSMLSMIANLTPFSDFNQSPRNMYQCQMGKQTMGTPCHALKHRSDNKMYRIQTPQTPLVRPVLHDYYGADNYPQGTNAVVAVISYTGYDMEDAMILNKGSYERGFCHGTIYKADRVNLKERRDMSAASIFGNGQEQKTYEPGLDADGFPPIGTLLKDGDPYYGTVNVTTGQVSITKYKSQEPAYVDQVKAIGDGLGRGPYTEACIVLRINRNPIIGDKFASRHGQKGICSKKWPIADMPFTESGMQPDILFNPHGFPSRMTIGMMIESMAGKSAAMHGLVHDATPFTFSEDEPAVDYFGNLLTRAGYNYYGTERLYSGIYGREFEADIFIGVVYYQRLRHMVSDKFQVRTTGPVDQVTHQPVKGRKKGGGIRFGEMERDALLAHGTSFLLQDRLLNCSDKSACHVCKRCGSMFSPFLEKPSGESAAASFFNRKQWTCSVCKIPNTIEQIAVPYVFKYMCAELAAMNIKLEVDIRQK